MVPLINAEMLGNNWMNATEVADIVAIAEMTPGPLGTNCATFAGMRVAGILGAIVANIGVLAPTMTLTLIIATMLERFKNASLLEDALKGIRPVSLGLVISVMISMGMQNYVSWQTITIAAAVAVAIWKFKLSVPIVISIAAALGLILVR